MKRRRSARAEGKPFGARVASVRGATALGSTSLGAAAAGAAAFGAVAVGALAIRRLAIGRGKVGHLSIEDLEVGRLRVRELVIEEQRSRPRPFDALEGHKYVSLTTFKKSGEAVSTPLWFATVDGSVYMTTPPDSGKMKRIRNDPRVRLEPSNAMGKPRGRSIEGIARPIEGGRVAERAEEALREKYRFGLALFHLFGKHEIGEVTLEVRPATDGPGEEKAEEAAR